MEKDVFSPVFIQLFSETGVRNIWNCGLFLASCVGLFPGLNPSLPVWLAALGSPSGLRFSDVTDQSAVVQWAEPRSRVDSYRVVYVPLQQGTLRLQPVSTELGSLGPGQQRTHV